MSYLDTTRFNLGPTILTERLILRPPSGEDFAGFAELMADEVATRFLGGVQHPATAWRGMTTLIGAWAIQGFAMFSVLEKSTGLWLGRVGPWRPEG